MDNDELEAEAVFRDMSWNEIMDDLNARFLLNLPKEELGLVRVYWQAEQAYVFLRLPKLGSVVHAEQRYIELGLT